MGGHYGVAVMVGVAIFLEAVQCQASCKGADGHQGEKGAPGRNGWPGVKGEKGEPAVMVAGPVDPGDLLKLRGEEGSRGMQGPQGPKGFRGALGAPGNPGTPGLRGLDGKSITQGQHSIQQARSAFSVIRTDHRYPAYNQKVTYQQVVVNTNRDLNTHTGVFTCRVPGTYYFNFHSMAKVSTCLYIAFDDVELGERKLGFCDYNKVNPKYDQVGFSAPVLSGGVVLQLTAGKKVWLESFKDQQGHADSQDNSEKKIIFNGFLLFTSPA